MPMMKTNNFLYCSKDKRFKHTLILEEKFMLSFYNGKIISFNIDGTMLEFHLSAGEKSKEGYGDTLLAKTFGRGL